MSQSCCSTSKQGREFSCSSCGAEGRSVGIETVRAIVKDDVEIADETYRFCTTTDCPVVYFGSNGALIEKSGVRVRVGIKETEEPIPVCYCFGFTQHDILDDVKTTGSATILDKIKVEVKAGNCACETNNPSGSCCLGEVSRIVKLGLTGTHIKEGVVK